MPLFLDLVRSETAASPERLAAALAGLRAYQQAHRFAPPPPMPVVAQAGRAMLRDYGGRGRPAIFVPSLINAPTVLDLQPGTSLLRWLAESGIRPLLVEWGSPTADDAALDIAGHVEALLLPLIDAIGRDAAVVGYCLGGTMALAAAARRPVAGLTLIAAPWHFAGYPQEAREAQLVMWTAAKPTAEAIDLCPLEVFQAAFWQLDPARTVAKFERFGRLDPASDTAAGFVALEDWANDGPPLTRDAARQLVEGFIRDDQPGRGVWHVDGTPVDAAALTCPVLDIASTTDRIVPRATAASLGTPLRLALGHVGMIVGGRARTALWEPLRAWLAALGPS
ncbi:alpha/beta fold hydrolase [Sphingomonas jatrophae]|uniref:Polyhydroxyalkanoate synthase n=1 Tax=Sphingomonas jatrophae TaxID=1166337 RepID=A0A1I6LC87_9SPHN|nr:alpha/beta fold hydrolase [Sphingomonas jatrophae]SFS01102.1 polyhydroxyalkanoate synthase [Sphingomonas jatrophae]